MIKSNSMYKRTLNLSSLLDKKSHFLFGPRATGKTTLIDKQLKNTALVYDLLDNRTYGRLLKKPSLLEEESQNSNKIIVIDEVQKLPLILDEVHRLIQKKNKKFLLTGSSSRKLKHGSANLLAGRAWQAEMHVLTSQEINDFDLLTYINTGGLPTIYGSQYHKEELESYAQTYLKEEIQAESLTRNLQAFSNFLEAIALSNGQEINYRDFSSDCGVSAETIKNYIEILSDTLIGFSLKGYTKTKKRKAISRAKHYLFDIGVANYLSKKGDILPQSKNFGDSFEHFIILEVRAYNSYLRRKKELFYWRSTAQHEVDLIIGNDLAIEIKSTTLVNNRHLKGIRALKEEQLIKKMIVISQDPHFRKTNDGIEIWPYQEFLASLWKGLFF